MLFCFVQQRTAYDMRISDWSSDVCSSDLIARPTFADLQFGGNRRQQADGHEFRGDKCEDAQCHRENRAPVSTRMMGVVMSSAHSGSFRSEERREGNECVSKCRSRCMPVY